MGQSPIKSNGNVTHPSGEWFSIAERPINELEGKQSVPL